jgi:hypothetical protein
MIAARTRSDLKNKMQNSHYIISLMLYDYQALKEKNSTL